MISIDKLQLNQIEILAGMYEYIVYNFGVEPLETSEKKQKKIRKWINRQYSETIKEMPEKLARQFSEEVSDSGLFTLLKDCHTNIEDLGDEKKRKFDNACAEMNIDTKNALWSLLESEYMLRSTRDGNSMTVVIDDSSALIRKLILHGVNDVPFETHYGKYIRQSRLVFKQEEQLYCFYGELEDHESDAVQLFALTFEDAEVSYDVYNSVPSSSYIWKNPWELLNLIAEPIALKADISEKLCNEQELTLLPIIRDINALNDPIMKDKCNFITLKSKIAEYGYTSILDIFVHLENGSKKRYALCKKIVAELNKREHEPLWRDIYNEICESQKDYPLKAETVSEKLRFCTRSKITSAMKENGFDGEFPYFYKKNPIKGIRLDESYDMEYFIGFEKNTVSRIYCYENFVSGVCYSVQFICATELPSKKYAPCKDIFDCLFNTKGKTFFNLVDYNVIPGEEETKLDELDISVNAAIKKAELRKLSKTEKDSLYGHTPFIISPLTGFLFFFLFGGGLFSILMNAFMMMLGVVIFLIVGRADAIPAMFTDFPWGKMIAFTWIGFGGSMGLFSALAKRK